MLLELLLNFRDMGLFYDLPPNFAFEIDLVSKTVLELVVLYFGLHLQPQFGSFLPLVPKLLLCLVIRIQLFLFFQLLLSQYFLNPKVVHLDGRRLFTET
jgi:hypothetical protein